AEPDMGDLHRRRHAVDDDDLVAPVELVGFPRRKRQGNERFRRRARVPLAPAPRIAANRSVTAGIAQRHEILVNPNDGQSLSRRPALVLVQKRVKTLRHGPIRGRGWRERSYRNSVAFDFPRHTQLAADLLDRLTKLEIGPTYLGDRLHNQHSNPGL